MGIEYPVLAFIAALGIAMIALAMLFLYIYITGELARVPYLSGYAEASALLSTTRVVIKVAHERGEPVELKRITLYTEKGAISMSPSGGASSGGALLRLSGFVDSTLLPGSTGYIVVDLLGVDYFVSGKEYKAVLEFDKGTLVLSFTLVYEARV